VESPVEELQRHIQRAAGGGQRVSNNSIQLASLSQFGLIRIESERIYVNCLARNRLRTFATNPLLA